MDTASEISAEDKAALKSTLEALSLVVARVLQNRNNSEMTDTILSVSAGPKVVVINEKQHTYAMVRDIDESLALHHAQCLVAAFRESPSSEALGHPGVFLKSYSLLIPYVADEEEVVATMEYLQKMSKIGASKSSR